MPPENGDIGWEMTFVIMVVPVNCQDKERQTRAKAGIGLTGIGGAGQGNNRGVCALNKHGETAGIKIAPREDFSEETPHGVDG